MQISITWSRIPLDSGSRQQRWSNSLPICLELLILVSTARAPFHRFQGIQDACCGHALPVSREAIAVGSVALHRERHLSVELIQHSHVVRTPNNRFVVIADTKSTRSSLVVGTAKNIVLAQSLQPHGSPGSYSRGSTFWESGRVTRRNWRRHKQLTFSYSRSMIVG